VRGIPLRPADVEACRPRGTVGMTATFLSRKWGRGSSVTDGVWEKGGVALGGGAGHGRLQGGF